MHSAHSVEKHVSKACCCGGCLRKTPDDVIAAAAAAAVDDDPGLGESASASAAFPVRSFVQPAACLNAVGLESCLQ